MPTAYVLSSNDREMMRQLVKEYMDAREGATNRPADNGIDRNEHQAPEVYIAKTPGSGINAMTGTAPQYADCIAWMTVTNGTGFLLEAVSQLVLRVFNYNATAIAGNKYIVVTRDKWGKWIALEFAGATANYFLSGGIGGWTVPNFNPSLGTGYTVLPIQPFNTEPSTTAWNPDTPSLMNSLIIPVTGAYRISMSSLWTFDQGQPTYYNIGFGSPLRGFIDFASEEKGTPIGIVQYYARVNLTSRLWKFWAGQRLTIWAWQFNNAGASRTVLHASAIGGDRSKFLIEYVGPHISGVNPASFSGIIA